MDLVGSFTRKVMRLADGYGRAVFMARGAGVTSEARRPLGMGPRLTLVYTWTSRRGEELVGDGGLCVD